MMIKIVALLFTTFFLWACLSPNDSSMIKSFKLGDTTTIHYQEIIYNSDENVSIKFNSVEDSRCPAHLLCYWEGNAKVSLIITKDSFNNNFILNTYRQFTKDTILFGYSISLLKVMPFHPDTIYTKSDYSADLLISKQ